MSTPTSEEGASRSPMDQRILEALSGLPDDFVNFDQVYQSEIRPALQRQEGRRRKAANTARKSTWLGAAGGGVGAVAGFAALDIPQLGIASLVIAGVAIFLGRSPLRKIKSESKDLIVEPVARALDIAFEPQTARPLFVSDAREIGLLPRWDREKFEDRLGGTRNGVDYDFVEAHLEERRTTTDGNGRTRTRWVTVFKGQCIRFDFHKSFRGQTLVTRDAGIFNRFKGQRGMDRAGLEDPVFEKAFEVYTTDQVEARYLLTPAFMERLVALETAFRGKKLRCAFSDGDMMLCLEGDDLFDTGSMFNRLDDPERMRSILNDFSSIFYLLDELVAARRQPHGG